MLNLSKMKKVDASKMFETYDNWAELTRIAYDSDKISLDFKKFDHIVLAGMGGSGTICDVFSSILSKTNIHTSVIKGYNLPRTVNKNTLVISVSVSGNTKETLSILKKAHQLKTSVISFSSGGKLQDFSIKNNLNHVKINMVHSPRASLPIYLYQMLKILEDFIPLEEKDIFKSINELKNTTKNINSSNLTKSNSSLNLAKWITKTPVIYYPLGLQSAAIRFKNNLQENCKMQAITEDVVEACHNGIVGWEKQASCFKPILIHGNNDFIKTKETQKIIKEFFFEKNIEFKEIYTNHSGILSKIINLIYILDYTTIFRAILSNTDPSPVKAIEYIKSKLK